MASETPTDTNDVPDSRFHALSSAIDTTLEKIGAIFSTKFMAKCYPSIARKYPDTPEQLRKTLMESIRKRVIADLEDFYADLNLKANLDLVDRLEAEQRTLSLNERVWRPTGDPSRDLLAHDLPLLQSFKDDLATQVADLTAQVDQKKEQVLKSVRDIEEERRLILAILEKNQRTISALSAIA